MKKIRALKKILKKYARNKRHLANKKYQIIFAIALPLLVIGAIFIYSRVIVGQHSQSANGAQPEIQKILATEDPDERARLYRQLLERVGIEGQEMLLRSGLPFNGSTHLLNHTTGQYLYDKFGLEGVRYCKDYFLGSCYHGVLIGNLNGSAEKDIENIQTIVDSCKRDAPTTLQQCIHGIGHAYLPANGYAKVDVALQECENLAKLVADFNPWSCYDGVFMENIWALHNGGPSPDRWAKDDDDRYPCNYPGIKPEYISACWVNQPQLLEPRYQGSLSKIDDLCITVEQEDARELCYNAVARQVHSRSNGNPDVVFGGCAELRPVWEHYCHVTNATYSLILGDKKMPYEICVKLQGQGKIECYDKMITNITYHMRSAIERSEACGRIHEVDVEHKLRCLDAQKI